MQVRSTAQEKREEKDKQLLVRSPRRKDVNQNSGK